MTLNDRNLRLNHIRTAYKLLRQSYELCVSRISSSTHRSAHFSSHRRRRTHPCHGHTLGHTLLRSYGATPWREWSPINQVLLYRPLPIPFDYGQQAFKFVNPLVTVLPTPPTALLDLHLLSMSCLWMMSLSDSPEPLIPARALLFAVAHRTTGDGVKKDMLHVR